MTISAVIVIAPIDANAQADNVHLIDDYRILNDVSPGDGACQTSAGTCTLRAAIQEANATPAETTEIGVAADLDPLTAGVQPTATVWQGTVAGGGSPPVASTTAAHEGDEGDGRRHGERLTTPDRESDPSVCR